MVPINSSLLFRFRTALVYNDTNYSVNFMTLWSSTVYVNLLNGGDLAYRIALMNILLLSFDPPMSKAVRICL